MADKITQLELELYSIKKCEIVKAVNESTFKCSHCSEIFQSEVSLSNHIEKQHIYYKCEMCKYQATSSTILKSHMKKKHSPEVLAFNKMHGNTFDCYFCGHKCHDNQGHMQHMTACLPDWEAPSDIKMLCFKCHLCEREFSDILPQGRFHPVDNEAGAECAECFALQ